MKKRILLRLWLIILLPVFLFSTTEYKVSGKVVYNGKGLSGVLLEFSKVKGTFSKEVKTNNEGNFHVYLPSGTYKVMSEGKDGYVSKEIIRIIKVAGKNIENLVIPFEKGCEIYGVVKENGGRPIKEGHIIISNRRGIVMSETDGGGRYYARGVRYDKNTKISLYVDGYHEIKKEIKLLKEGEKKEINFILKTGPVIKGKIVDVETKKPIKDVFIAALCNVWLIYRLDSNEKGEFRLMNAKKGYYIMMFFHPFYKYKIKIYKFNKKESKKMIIELKKLSKKEKKEGKYFGFERK